MRVLMQLRSNATGSGMSTTGTLWSRGAPGQRPGRMSRFAEGGGEATQAREIAAGLRARGIQVDLTDAVAPDLTGVDLIHVFGLTQPSEPLLQAENARAWGVPIVLSPAWVDFTEYNRRGRYGVAALAYRAVRSERLLEGLKQVMRLYAADGRRARLARLLLVSFEEQQRRLLSSVALLLPNSRAEASAIANRFRYAGPAAVVPYGASPRFREGVADPFVARTSLRDFVIGVGFITSLKNQMRLIAAIESTGLHLVLAGGRVPTHRAYYRAVQRAAAGRRDVTMLGHVPHAELPSVLAAARVVALPSWFETCGIAGLEGALAGCRVVVTNRGYTSDYFGSDAVYCDPSDVASIRHGVLEAFEAPAPAALQQRILDRYTWEAAVDATLDAYRSVACCA